MVNQPNLQEAEKRAQIRAVSQEIEIMKQEQIRAEEQERESELERRARDANIERSIMHQLSNLKPIYEKRQAAFKAMTAALTDFMEAESEIVPALNRALESIPNQAYMESYQRRAKWVQLVQQAGITSEHSQFSGGTPIARTIAIALAQGIIQPGQIAYGKTTINFEV